MRYSLALFLLFSTIISIAQKPDRKLQAKVESLLKGFNGQVGVFVYDLKKDRSVAVNADTVFTSASMVKVPILFGVMNKIEKGELTYHQELVYKDSLLYAGVDILGSFKNDEKIELSKVMMLMLSMSDNTASLWLQTLAGGGATINHLLDSTGFKNTRVNSRTAGREEDRNRYGWGQTTPREMTTLMRKIVRGELVSKPASDRMLRLLGRNYWDEESNSQIPPGVFVASKSGAVHASRSEVLYVNGNNCRYMFCICTQNNKDQSWTTENEAWLLARKLSLMLWKYYNPRSDWNPSTR